ncbi:F-box/FBD/LRR-repeat protein At5g22660-like [Arachis stenosperma]|uniref:F-box/FBD/LRR-repeat protein At5g22660-like n=1 Tax=Arachis stenosperma TaxID=217475 RepID=UPI0025AD14D2|nr:F-box/FBD/LRR-repeat protein At5g22660-like [Arachis stenosperma]
MEIDRISFLPKAILHDIIGRLPDKDAARTSVLSKSWSETWFSFPILSACSENFFSLARTLPIEHPLWLSKLDIFIGYVGKRLRRLCDQGLAVKELKLNLQYRLDRMHVSHHVDQWIQMAAENGVEVLELHLAASGCMDKWYNLPLCVAEAKTLTKLVLIGGIRLDPAFLKYSLKFFSMRTLSLSCILFGGEGIMEHFISHCPLIEHLTLEHLTLNFELYTFRTVWVKSLSLHGLQKLKGVDIKGIQEVYIDAPNLEDLSYRALATDGSFKLSLDSCTNLRCLSLWHLMSPDKWLLELLYKNPFLESLMLHNCCSSERINISGPQLKFFTLSHFYDNLKEVNIDAPNLLSCDYMGIDKPVISFQRISDQLEVNAHMHINHRHISRLREFFQNIKPQKVLASLSLFIFEPLSISESLGILRISSSPPSIKCVELCVLWDNEAPYFPFMNWLLSSCFPESISFSLRSYFKMKAFIVYFYEMLMGSKKGKCDCCSRSFKCWWHGLKVVKVTYLGRTYENVEDLKAMLDALPEFDAEEFITFGLEL